MRCYWALGRFHFGFGMRPFPRREDYLRMLERYKKDLEVELKEVEREIELLQREKSPSAVLLCTMVTGGDRGPAGSSLVRVWWGWWLFSWWPGLSRRLSLSVGFSCVA